MYRYIYTTSYLAATRGILATHQEILLLALAMITHFCPLAKSFSATVIWNQQLDINSNSFDLVALVFFFFLSLALYMPYLHVYVAFICLGLVHTYTPDPVSNLSRHNITLLSIHVGYCAVCFRTYLCRSFFEFEMCGFFWLSL